MFLPEIIAVVLRAADEAKVPPPNRTQLQKLVYFVTDKLEHAPVHRAHYYGPYSPDVSEATLDLVDMNVVDEDCLVSYGRSDATEIREYSYSLTEMGRGVAELISKRSPAESGEVMRLVQHLFNAGGTDTRTLAIAAKVHYILKRYSNVTPEETKAIIRRAAGLGWDINTDDVTSAIEFLTTTHLMPTKT
jgi:uncharacterized protein YwgA